MCQHSSGLCYLCGGGGRPCQTRCKRGVGKTPAQNELRLIRAAQQRPEPDPIDTLWAVGAMRLALGLIKAPHRDRCACGLYSWRNRPCVGWMSIEPKQLPADCRRAGDILAWLGDKWTILLLMVLGDRRMRFAELHRTINGISKRMSTVMLCEISSTTRH